MEQFPLEIVHRILDYDGRIKCRNGKFMNQISTEDDRYCMLQNMPKLIPNRYQGWDITIFTKTHSIYVKKHLVWYSAYVDKDVVWVSGTKTPVFFLQDEKSLCYYCFTHSGFCYKWKIFRET